MTGKLAEIYFSQAALTAYQTCPRKFKYRYLDDLGWLRSGEQAVRQTERRLGDRFHLIAQRYFQQVEAELLQQAVLPDPLAEWFANLRACFPLHTDNGYYPEQEARVNLPGLRLMAKYDLLIRYPQGKIVIYDWKTSGAKPRKARETLQEKIYPLVLCEAAPFGALQPEDITMIFWNPRFPHAERVIPYNREIYMRDREMVSGLLRKILDSSAADFIPLKQDDALAPPQDCRYCEFNGLCSGSLVPPLLLSRDPGFGSTWDEIAEISYAEDQL